MRSTALTWVCVCVCRREKRKIYRKCQNKSRKIYSLLIVICHLLFFHGCAFVSFGVSKICFFLFVPSNKYKKFKYGKVFHLNSPLRRILCLCVCVDDNTSLIWLLLLFCLCWPSFVVENKCAAIIGSFIYHIFWSINTSIPAALHFSPRFLTNRADRVHQIFTVVY